MLKELAPSIGSILPVLSLVFFFAFFAGVIIYILTDRRGGHSRHMLSLPFDDDQSTKTIRGEESSDV